MIDKVNLCKVTIRFFVEIERELIVRGQIVETRAPTQIGRAQVPRRIALVTLEAHHSLGVAITAAIRGVACVCLGATVTFLTKAGVFGDAVETFAALGAIVAFGVIQTLAACCWSGS
jgi:hypothetical protein